MNVIPEPLQQLVRADLSPAEAQQLVQPLRSFSLGALQQMLVQGGIKIEGNGNVIGHGNLILSGEGTARWNLALTWEHLGDRAQAIACAQAALVIREQIEDPNAAKVRKALDNWNTPAPANEAEVA